ncbi:sigma-54-dependent Fis family transcriptional regulator [Bacteroidia bacterium]|nr:sigma-54-dependent Fis family transcriptional regulator [Bacteroidia bacterium]
MANIDIQQIKQRFGIIGNSPLLNREIEKALLIAPTDLTVLITGESGVGKEVFPQIIHQNSARKHGAYIAVNCGAIPEGTIDSELFGHEKGSFTGALNERKGYFEVADKGTIFLDEVGELPISTQARLLRVLEYGEFIKVGSSKVQKADVRIVAATNVDLMRAIRNGKFREDLYYRLNTVPIIIPPLRERQEDIYLLFRKFASDFAEKYRMPAIHLTDDAKEMLMKYRWPGNIRELRNITERMSIFEHDREINAERLKTYLSPVHIEQLPAIVTPDNDTRSFANEREILYQVLFDMKKDINELKKIVAAENPTTRHGETAVRRSEAIQTLPPVRRSVHATTELEASLLACSKAGALPLDRRRLEPAPNGEWLLNDEPAPYADEVTDEITSIFDPCAASLEEVEKEMIKKALERHKGKRRDAAQDLKISERTLYRKIKEYGME